MLNIDFSNSFRSGTNRDVYYFATDRDEEGVVRYYGFESTKGNWYIVKDDITTPSAKTTRYAVGKSDYVTNWTNKASLTYDYASNV